MFRILGRVIVGVLLVGLLLVVLDVVLSDSDDTEEGDQANVPAATRTPRNATATPRKATATPRKATATPRAAPAAADGAAWTILVYLDGDNNLEDSAVADFIEMATVGSTDKLNIVVQMDRIRSDEDWDDRSNGNWETVKRFRIMEGQKPTKANQLSDLGELNMGDPKTLQDFVVWGVKTYPAQRYGLIFWDHGSSWPGVANDDTSDGDPITMPELIDALRKAQRQTNNTSFDLIGFDTCLMGQLDVLAAVAPFGKVGVGSADLEPGDGWAWNDWLDDLAAQPEQSAAEIAPRIVESFAKFYKKQKDPSVTLAAFDLREIETLQTQVDTLAGTMIDDMKASYKAIGRARSYVGEYDSDDEELGAIDLGHFAQLLIEAAPTEEIATAAQDVLATLEAARLAEYHGKDHPNSTGLSIYFPRKSKFYSDEYVDGSPLPAATQWEEFLQAFYQGNKNTTTRAVVSKPEISTTTVSINDPLALQAKVEGDDTAYVYYFVGAVSADQSDTLELLFLDYLYPPGTTVNSDTPSWENGDTVRLNWAAQSWYLANSDSVISIPLSPTDYGSAIYSVEGVYTSQNTGDEIPVSIEFEMKQGQGTLVHVWGFDEGANGDLQPFELDPRAGDTFTPDITIYSDANADVEESAVAGETITFDSEPLVAFEGPAPNGDYVIGLLVENIAGDVSDEYAEVEVNNPADAPLAVPGPPPAQVVGAKEGSLRYGDPELGFQVDYPSDWEAFDAGTGKVVFGPIDNERGIVWSIDVYELAEEPATANTALLQEVLAAFANDPGFKVLGETQATLADLTGPEATFVYEDTAGTPIQANAVVVTDPASGLSYLVMSEAPADGWATSNDLFDAMRSSFQITN